MSRLEDVGRAGGFYFSACELMTTEFPEPRWAVPGLLPEGLTLLVGAPKLGKSWLVLGLAVAVASGGRALGSIAVEAGPVLYAALEDNPRRLKERLGRLLGGESAPTGLEITTQLPRGPQVIEVVAEWLDEHSDARMIIVDVIRRVRGQEDPRADRYAADYELVSALKALADKYRVAIVLVHHTRKAADDDVVNEVSGSTGLTGAADAIVVMRRSRNTAIAELHVTGRDVAEAEHACTFDAVTGTWRLSPESVTQLTLGETRKAVLAYLRDNPGATPTAVAAGTSLTSANAKQLLRRMVDDGQLENDGNGRYTVTERVSPASPLSPATDDGDTGDAGDSTFWDPYTEATLHRSAS